MCCDRHRDNCPPPSSLILTPPTSTEPPVGESRPPIKLSRVVLPEPEGPMSARKSPFGISRFTPCSTSMRSPPRLKCLCTPATRTSPLPSLIPLFLKVARGASLQPCEHRTPKGLRHSQKSTHFTTTSAPSFRSDG